MARPKVHPKTLAKVRVAVYARDGYRCQACEWSPVAPAGYAGRYALYAPDERPGRAGKYRILELDHVTPFIHGGKFEVGNLQALCNSCNVRKGATI